jgi:hypothetical protein
LHNLSSILLTNFHIHSNTYLLQHKSSTSFTQQKLLFTYKNSSVSHTRPACCSEKSEQPKAFHSILQGLLTPRKTPNPTPSWTANSATPVCYRPGEKFTWNNSI